MDGGSVLAAALLCWSCGVCVVSALHRTDLVSYGALSGDLILAEGDDETSRVLTLPRPLYFYDTPFHQLYVATNGIISAQDLPMEKQYVDDGFPTDFPVVAPFLADIDTSGGRGHIYYRVTETPSVLNRVAQEVRRGFPDANFAPTHAVVATWENVAAYEDQTQGAELSNKVNTFQAVIGYDEMDSYTLFLYPEDGLNFFGTQPKELYNVKIELPARVGFSRGEVTFFIFSRSEGPFYSVTTDEKSVKRLSQVGNTGIPGVWLFHTGNRHSFENIIPAAIGGLLSTLPPEGHALSPDTTTPEYGDYPDNTFESESQEEVDGYTVTGKDLEFQPVPDGGDSGSLQPGSPGSTPPPSEDSEHQVTYNGEEGEEGQYVPPNHPERRAQQLQEQKPQLPLEVVEVNPSPENEPPLSPGGYVVSVDEEDVDFDTGVIQYTTENKETCARFQQQCSQNAICSDYATGFCCHCRTGFYGNGRQCLPDGAPQRVSGKVRGTVTVGSFPIVLDNIDLHAYIVVGDGRAYTAISQVPEPVGWALMPVSPVGELFGWLFALELPNSQAGFKTTGAEFTRHAEVLFNPGNQRLSIVQTGSGLDEHNHLRVETIVSGHVPLLPPGAEVTVQPFKETYQYYPSVITSSSVREFVVVSAERGSQSYTFHLKQNITYRDCRHDNRATPETLQITMERVFVMYVKEERILRYAITNKISPVGAGSDDELLNPCYVGNHDCDTTAQCIPLEGQAFKCQCATGYTGDGHNCYDIDECAEGSDLCGDHSQCLNLPGSHRCQCREGFETAFDGRNCVDVDECSSSPCHINARCINDLGSFRCHCQHGFRGDGFYCAPQEGRPKSQCEQHRDSLQSGGHGVGAHIPQCDSDGQYRSLQCHGSTGYCWCVDDRGQERPGTRTSPGTTPKDCDKPDDPQRPKTHCEHHRDSIQTTSPDGRPLLGVYAPQCDEHGHYEPQQCLGSTGYCWCVDSRGQERPGTRTAPGTPHVDCDKPDRPKTHCEHHRDSVQTTSPDGHPLLGAYVPQCDEHGHYQPQQCHGSTGHCWCVDDRGQERPGTRTPPGTPHVDCRRPERPKTQCELHRDRVQHTGPDGHPIVGAHIPQCDEHGHYQPQQCHGSTGHCWCVDDKGQERPGTRTPPGTPRVDCRRPEGPKTHCELHRDRVQHTGPDGHPIVGAHIPQCDEHGHYQPQQCHGSTGHCWCVDDKGQERPGTRTPPGTPHVDCRRPDRPKTHCELHRDRVQHTGPDGHPIEGAYVPQCDEHGHYQPQQCHGSTGHCWCVDDKGQERPGTRTPPGTPHVDCRRPERPKTHCEQHRDRVQHTGPDGHPIVGAHIPQCDEHGHYQPQQCHGSTGHCWCVDDKGQERPGTRTPPGTPHVDCRSPERPKTHCELHRDRVQHTGPDGHPIVGAHIPQCDEHGHYQPQQCHGSTGHCWCVDDKGQERPGTRTPPGTPHVDCRRPERPKTHCELHRDRVPHTGPDGHPIVGAHIPQCDEHGHYQPQQCHGSTGHCWCVDDKGQERPGTRTPPGTPHVDCRRPDRPKTHCEQHRDRVQHTSPIVGAHIPQCDEHGHYQPQQCHGSTGHCWCVDDRGQERPGTRTPPGTPHVDCRRPDDPQHPKTHCEHHRDSVQTTSPDGHPLVGAYVPQCDEHGHYQPQQCHGSTGHCWCVDDRGQERPGTRTPPGTPHVDCRRPEHPKTHCEQQRDRVQHTGPDGHPIVGAHIPQCDEHGHYQPQQCHGSTGHCWCVDDMGQERPGTRTPPGTPHVDCRRPERLKTHCEQHRDRVQVTSPGGHPIEGAYVPQCDEHGHYQPQQCHGSTGHCWCVDDRGQERPGTRTPPGTPHVDCRRPDRPKTHCEQHRDRVQHTGPDGHPIVGAHIPQCDEHGHYQLQQCHGSTGHCWCVDDKGQERPGTRTPPGTPHVDCRRPERPKTHCEQHRDRVQVTSPGGHPIEGAYIPQCDEHGHYQPQQCHGSTGHCWCVDDKGQERPGTRTPPGKPHVDCRRPERPKTHCEQHRDRVQVTSPGGHPIEGTYVPQCDEHGHYQPQQCHGSTGHCWCVDDRGQERPGTRTPPGTPHVDCRRPAHPKTHCEQHRDRVQVTSPGGHPIEGTYVPQCDEHGHYQPQQCHGSTGHCWCVDDRGQERPGTRTPPGTPRIDCSRSERPKTSCEQHKERAEATSSEGYPIAGAYVPQCDAKGQYIPLQCYGSTGHCWCVDPSGQERPGTRTPPGTPPKDCDKPGRPKTPCEQHRDRVQATTREGYPVVGGFEPRCDAEGQYLPQQCHGSNGHCWCVDSSGQERPGTRTPPGTPPKDCSKPASTSRPESVCERWRASLMEHYGGKPDPQQYLPQCEPTGEFSPVQCYGHTTYCWCVDENGREVPGTRSHDVVKPACLPSVTPPTARPMPRPDVTPPSNADVTLLYAQGQKIGALPLNGTRLDSSRSRTLLTLHGSIVVGIAYDCKENQVYWTDLSARTINRASVVSGAEPEILINSNLVSPEGLAVDVKRRLMFWVDSSPDVIESANLDGSRRRILFDTDLVNPRAIIVVSSTGTLYWTDWNREAPKIESSSVDGLNRRVVVSDGVGLPNALTYDSSSGQVCWADAGTKRLECISPNGSGRRVIHPTLNYPFSMVYYRNHFYYTDWRRDGVIAVSKDSSKFTDEYLPEQRSHLYGVTIATTYCLPGNH